MIRADNVRYSVPVERAYHPCVIEVFVDKIKIFCDRQLVAVHKRCYIPGQFILEPTHYLRLLRRKPGSLDNARAFEGQPWGEDFDMMRKELEYRYDEDGTMRYIKVLMLFTEYPEVQVKAAVNLCVRRRAFSEEAVLTVPRNEPLPQRAKLDLSDRPELANQNNGSRIQGFMISLRAERRC